MRHLDWVNNISQFEEIQAEIEDHCQSLIDAYFSPDDNYAIEKFLKIYTEGFRYMEHLLLLQRGVAPESFKNGPTMPAEEAHKLQQEVKEIMMNDAKRQFRHAIIAFPSMRTVSANLEIEQKNFTLLENAIDSVLPEEDASKVFSSYHSIKEIAQGGS